VAKNKGVEVPETYQIRLSMSVSPHIKSRDDVPRIMRDVVIALVPAALGAIFYFRAGAALVMAVCIMSCLVTEYLCSKFLFGQRVVIDDWSAVICGLLLAFTLPPGLPLWIAAIGGACAIFFGKAVFGGLGQNIFNPALVGRAILLASWPVAMTTWKAPASAVDAVTSATPLGLVKESAAHAAATLPRYTDLLLGNATGSGRKPSPGTGTSPWEWLGQPGRNLGPAPAPGRRLPVLPQNHHLAYSRSIHSNGFHSFDFHAQPAV